MKTSSLLWLALVSCFLISCSSSSDVVSDGLFQKRKYRKGYHINSPFKQEQSSQGKGQHAQRTIPQVQEYTRPVVRESIKDSTPDFKSLSEEIVGSLNMSKEEIKDVHNGLLYTSIKQFSSKNLEKNLILAQQNKRIRAFYKKLIDDRDDKKKDRRLGVIAFSLFLGSILFGLISFILLAVAVFEGGFVFVILSFALFLLTLLAFIVSFILAIVSLARNISKDDRTQREIVDMAFAIATLFLIVLLIALSIAPIL